MPLSMPLNLILPLLQNCRNFLNIPDMQETRPLTLEWAGKRESFNCLIIATLQGGVGSGHASLYKEVFKGMQPSICDVKIITIDSFCLENQITQIDLLKIDTEGNEFSILEGSKKMLSEHRIKTIHFEFGDRNVYSHVFMRDFFDILSDYDIYRMLPYSLLKLDYEPFFCEIFGYQNMVAVLKSRNS